jgi:hypothetical protein
MQTDASPQISRSLRLWKKSSLVYDQKWLTIDPDVAAVREKLQNTADK